MTEAFSVPVVDITELLATGVPTAGVVEHLDRACCEVGFLAVVGHGIDDDLLAAVLAEAHRFFALPDGTKRAIDIALSSNNRGYGAVAGEQLQPDLAPDLKETFDFGPERSLDDPDLSPLDGPNQWPDLDGFRAPLERYQDEAIVVARHLMRVVAAANTLPYDHFEPYLLRPIVTTRLNHYPKVDRRTSADQLGCGAHSDYGCLTLLYGDGTPGLQLMTVGGEWIDVTVPDGALIVNLGDLLMRWTNDRYRSTKHRVIPPTERDRFSVPVFFNPEWHTEVRCFDHTVTADRPPRYAPVLSGEYLQSRYDDTFVYRQSERASA